jgi:parallel beta-helix repeat protein
MAILIRQNHLRIENNSIHSAETAGIYIEGPESRPIVEKNKIRFCKSAAIKLGSGVTAEVRILLPLTPIGIKEFHGEQ